MSHWAWVEEKYVQVCDEADGDGMCDGCRAAPTHPHNSDCSKVFKTPEDTLVDCMVTQAAENIVKAGGEVNEDGVVTKLPQDWVDERARLVIGDEVDPVRIKITGPAKMPDDFAGDITKASAKGLKDFLEAPSNPPQEPTFVTEEAIEGMRKLIEDEARWPDEWPTVSEPVWDRHVVEALCEKWVDGEDYKDADEVYENGISDMDAVYYELGNDLIGYVREMQNAAMLLMVAKNADYGGDDDPLRNFKLSDALGVDMTTGIALRMSDKWARLCGYMKSGELKVKDESVKDTLLDLMNYAGILLFAINEKERG